MDTRKGRSKFKNFRIILDSGCRSTIATRRLVNKLGLKKDAVMQWQTQAENITTSFMVQVVFTLPKLSVTNVMTWKCHVYDSSWGRYYMILGRDL